MNLHQDKLTLAVLPICYWAGFKNIYIVGFDGIGGRYFAKSNVRGIRKVKPSIDHFLPLWNSWKEYHGMTFYSLVPEKECILNKHIEYIPIKEFV